MRKVRGRAPRSGRVNPVSRPTHSYRTPGTYLDESGDLGNTGGSNLGTRLANAAERSAAGRLTTTTGGTRGMRRRELLKRGIGLGLGLALAPLGAGVARAEEKWVQTWKPAELWSNSGPTAVSFGMVRPFTYLRLHGEVEDGRIYVYNPRTQNFAFVDAGSVGPSAPPSAAYLKGPAVKATLNMPARASGTASIYREPVLDDLSWTHDLQHNDIILVKDL